MAWSNPLGTFKLDLIRDDGIEISTECSTRSPFHSETCGKRWKKGSTDSATFYIVA